MRPAGVRIFGRAHGHRPRERKDGGECWSRVGVLRDDGGHVSGPRQFSARLGVPTSPFRGTPFLVWVVLGDEYVGMHPKSRTGRPAVAGVAWALGFLRVGEAR